MATALDETHEKLRKRVCIVCYRKASRNLSAKEISIVQEHLIEHFDIDNPDFPSGVCGGCHMLLLKKGKGDSVDFFLPDDYDPRRQTNTRSCKKCECRICSVALMSLQDAVKLKRKSGRPQTNVIPPVEHFKICGRCFAKIYRGSNHSVEMCSSRRARVYNVESLLDSPSKQSKQRVASRTINESTSLATLGNCDRRIPPKRESLESPIIQASTFTKIQQRLYLSTREVNKLSQDLRNSNPGIVERRLRDKLFELNHSLDGFFDLRLLPFKIQKSDDDSKEEWAVVCRDLNVFVDFVLRERGIDNDSALIKIGIDGGGGFIKCCLSIFDPSDDATGTSRRSEFKDSGVKRCFIIGIVPEVPENYYNLKQLWINVGIHLLNRKFTIASDLKLCNILLGLMSHSSVHPCSWCDIKKDRLDCKGNQRTLGTLRKLFWNYYDDGAVKEKAKYHGNVVHPPMFCGKSDITTVISLVPPPELHLLTGPVNTIFSALRKLWPQADEWLLRCGIQREGLHGGSFTGNASRKLLANVDVLEQMVPNNQIVFVEAFRRFKDVIDSCYGSTLDADYATKIELFKISYQKLKIPITPKIHAVIFHITEFCSFNGNKGLGPWSEQTSESVHYDFQRVWDNYKIRSTENNNYGKQLLSAVCRYNSLHL